MTAYRTSDEPVRERQIFVIPHAAPSQRFGALAAVVFSALLVAWIGYDRSDLVCRRAEPGAVPHCTGSSGVLFTTALSFDYASSDSLHAVKREKNGHYRTVVATPAGDLRGGVDNKNAAGIVAAGSQFRDDANALGWEIHPRFDVTAYCIVAAGIGVVLLSVLRRTRRVVIDEKARTLFVNPKNVIRLDAIESVELESIARDRARGVLTIVTKDAQRIELVRGSLAALRPVEEALNAR